MSVYVEFSGPIDDYCEVSSLSFGMQASVVGNAGRSAQRHDVSFAKKADSLSSAIWRACALGTSFDTVWVEYYRGEDIYSVYTLSDVLVSSCSVHGSTEHISLDYKSLTTKFFGR